MESLISLRRLIWVCPVCLCPTKRTLGLYGLKSLFKINTCKSTPILVVVEQTLVLVRSVKLALILLQQKTVKLAAIFLQQKTVKLAAAVKNGKVSSNFSAAKNGKVGSNFSAAKNGQVSSSSKKR